MVLDKDTKRETASEYGIHEKDSGSTEVQVASLTQRINGLTEHLRLHNHDESTRRGLRRLVGKRRRLLRYLNTRDVSRYRLLIKKVGLKR